MNNQRFQRFCEANEDEQLRSIQQDILSDGFSAFRQFVESFGDKLKRYEDDEKHHVQTILDKCKHWFSEPGSISPAWQTIWQEYQCIITYKNEALESVSPEQRQGEWQILMDNPYTNQQIVCYPGLQFIEAAYLYGYFHHELEKNEYIRLQKIETLLVAQGK